jgi:pilus biogenesis lipoprotein CpaD
MLGIALMLVSACAPSVGPTRPESGREASATPILLEHAVHFETNTAHLSTSEVLALDSFLDTVGEHRGHRIVVLGRADERAGDAYNLALSSRRAAAVAKAIRSRGYPDVSVRALGEKAPVAMGDEEPAWRQNRRADILIVVATVEEPGCPDWSGNLANDPSNMTSTNFGCATARNLTQMVADPLDLAGLRSLAGADATRESDAVRRYRDGKTQPLPSPGASP